MVIAPVAFWPAISEVNSSTRSRGGNANPKSVGRRGGGIDGVVEPFAGNRRAEVQRSAGIGGWLNVGRTGGIVIRNAFAAGVEAFEFNCAGRTLGLIQRRHRRDRMRRQKKSLLKRLYTETSG